MIRLTHQFDDPRARATVASPTIGGCCCCCCCCIVTSIGACALTARAVGKGIDGLAVSAKFQAPSETVVAPEANFREPAVREVPVAPIEPPSKLPWMVFGFFLPVIPWLVLAFTLHLFEGTSWPLHDRLEMLAAFLSVASYVGLGVLFRKVARISVWHMVLMPILWAVISCGEAWLWLALMH